jgi:hypothetical protein
VERHADRLLALEALVASLAPCLALLAAVTPPPLPPDLGPEGFARLRAIERALDAGERDAQAWWTAWLFGLSAAAALQTAASLGVEHDAPVLQIGALRAAVGAASVALVPLPAAFAPGALRAMPEGTGADRVAKLQAAEGWLRRSARVERLGKSWWPRAGGLLLNTAGSLWLWLHAQRPGTAALSFVVGSLVGEAKIYTQPTAAIEAEERLLEPSAPAALESPGAAPRVRWTLSAGPGALVLSGAF